MTNTIVELITPKTPKLLAEYIHSNQVLKVFSLGLMFIAILLIVLLWFELKKPPLMFAFATSGEILRKENLPTAEDQVRVGIKAYIETRYNWTPENIGKKLKETEEFIPSKSRKSFQEAIANVLKFSVEKKVSQKIYPDKINVNLKEGIATISGDRISSVQGLKAAGNLRLELQFEGGPRTKENPWGLYILKEKEEEQ